VDNHFIELNEANFDLEVLDASEPVLVQFWADWSAACQAMEPMLQSVADGAPVSVKIARVNVQQHEDLAQRCGVRAVPTLLIFNGGGLQDQIIGRTTEQAVRETLRRLDSF
jgi:thioredoxin